MTAAALSPLAIARALEAFLDAERAAARAFSWPANNCCHFANRWVMAVNGVDVLADAADVVGRQAARRRLPDGLAAAVTARWWCGDRSVSLAQVGDVVLLHSAASVGIGQALGVCGGRNAWLMTTAGAPATVPMAEALRCWPLFARGGQP